MDRFMNRLIQLKKDGYRIIVNPTGGFKPESTYLTLVAMLAGIWRIIYSHESFRQIVELPTIPITIDPDRRKALMQVIEAKGASKGTLKQMDIDVDELVDVKLVDVIDGEVQVKEWVKKLLEITG
ncbi:MAG: putative CRISPR-associated protein [Vulcanisaeta sp.]